MALINKKESTVKLGFSIPKIVFDKISHINKAASSLKINIDWDAEIVKTLERSIREIEKNEPELLANFKEEKPNKLAEKKPNTPPKAEHNQAQHNDENTPNG